MSVLRNLESKIADLVEGTFGRVFRSEVRPVELARGLVKEMDQHKTVSVSRVYVPNEYVVWLSPEDRERFEGVEHEIADELGAYLLEHARREKLALVSRPEVTFADRRRAEARRVRHPGAPRARAPSARPATHAEQGDHGHTMVYSTSDRLQEELDQPARARAEPAARWCSPRASASSSARPAPSSAAAATATSTLDDPNVSRHHAEIRPDGRGGWIVEDLGSTNGVQGQRPRDQRADAAGAGRPHRARDRRRPVRRGVAAPGCSIPSPSP